MQSESLERAVERSLRRQVRIALLACGFLVFGVGGLAVGTEISGAVIGHGKIIAEGRAKHVQHPDGGIVSEILVTEGRPVEAGQVMFRLDGTRAHAALAVVERELDQLLAQVARLEAEQSRRDLIFFPPELTDDDSDWAQTLMEGQRELIVVRKQTRVGRKDQLTRQIEQHGEQVVALEAQQSAVEEGLKILEDQIEDFSHLQSKKLVTDSQLAALMRERATLIGSRASLTAGIVEVKQAIAEAELKRTQVDEEFFQTVLTELDQKRTEVAKLREERTAALDRLDRLEIRAPISGLLHELNLHTIGGVITGGETLVSIVPIDDSLIVEAQLSPIDVDQVVPDRTARIRLSVLDQRVTPELTARVIDVSPDLTTDPRTGVSYYVARLAISDEEMARIGDQSLKPGMPVEVFVETGTHSILSYLVKPISEQIRHAMRET